LADAIVPLALKVGNQKRPRFGSLPMMKSFTDGNARATRAVYAANFLTPFGSRVTSVLWPGVIESSTSRPFSFAAVIARSS
jgi:hypothetical protein